MNKKYSFYFLQDGASFPFLCNSDGCGFYQSKYNTDTARILIYNAWFEAIMVFCHFIGNIKRYQLWEKWATLLLHLSWIFIISGAFVTRYMY
jgi:hypothetical protein